MFIYPNTYANAGPCSSSSACSHPTACTAAAIGSTGYSLVFKGCSAANVAEYYDKTECVRDNARGLIWQGQTPAGTGLRANDQDKTNYDSTTAPQKNGNAPSQSEVDAITNSIGFKTAVKASNLCGSSAWRLPTKGELLSIVKSSESPSIDSSWFPNTPIFSNYWTSSPTSNGVGAWEVEFAYGTSLEFGDRGEAFDSALVSGYSLLVRLVR